jgi:hypothetical protein
MIETVAVAPGLPQVARYLAEKGYRIMEYGRHTRGVDAVVYLRTDQQRMVSAAMSPPGHSGFPGVLLIDGYGKTPDQIHEILRRGTYEPLW